MQWAVEWWGTTPSKRHWAKPPRAHAWLRKWTAWWKGSLRTRSRHEFTRCLTDARCRCCCAESSSWSHGVQLWMGPFDSPCCFPVLGGRRWGTCSGPWEWWETTLPRCGGRTLQWAVEWRGTTPSKRHSAAPKVFGVLVYGGGVAPGGALCVLWDGRLGSLRPDGFPLPHPCPCGSSFQPLAASLAPHLLRPTPFPPRVLRFFLLPDLSPMAV